MSTRVKKAKAAASKKPKQTRRKPLQERSAVTVDALLEATAQILVAEGYEQTTTNHVAERAGVSIGSLYQYFDNKDALVMELLHRHFRRLEAALQAAKERVADAPLEEAVVELIHALMQVETVNPELTHVIMNQLPRVGDFAIISAMEGRVEEWLAAFLPADKIYPREPALAAQVIVRAVGGLMRSTLLRAPGALREAALEQESVALVLGYLLYSKSTGTGR